MTNLTLGRWLLVSLAIIGLVFAAPVVSAHGDETAAEDTPTNETTAAEWATWTEAQMTDHMGPGSVEWMESHMGATIDEMGQHMASDDDHRGMDGQSHC